MKFYLKIKEKQKTETEETEEQVSYLYSTEGIVSFKDKEKAEKKAKSLATFINGFKAKKDASEIIIEEARRSKRKKESFRWVVQPSFYN
tara:strand:+ start:1368 stop:1634 length:267 start_codon:yes stop_codon:yes gene_type:complete